MILSIDVGIRNLAMCLLNETSNLVVQWDVSGVPPEHKDGIYVSLRNHLDERPWVLGAQTILIEKQPDRNKKMVSVMHFLYAYFIIKCPKAETILYDARHKIPDVAGPGKAQYAKRKKVSIERCEEFIRSSLVNAHWLDIFLKSKKKMTWRTPSCKPSALSTGTRFPQPQNLRSLQSWLPGNPMKIKRQRSIQSQILRGFISTNPSASVLRTTNAS